MAAVEEDTAAAAMVAVVEATRAVADTVVEATTVAVIATALRRRHTVHLRPLPTAVATMIAAARLRPQCTTTLTAEVGTATRRHRRRLPRATIPTLRRPLRPRRRRIQPMRATMARAAVATRPLRPRRPLPPLPTATILRPVRAMRLQRMRRRPRHRAGAMIAEAAGGTTPTVHRRLLRLPMAAAVIPTVRLPRRPMGVGTVRRRRRRRDTVHRCLPRPPRLRTVLPLRPAEHTRPVDRLTRPHRRPPQDRLRRRPVTDTPIRSSPIDEQSFGHDALTTSLGSFQQCSLAACV
jgi:hypothetical protein